MAATKFQGLSGEDVYELSYRAHPAHGNAGKRLALPNWQCPHKTLRRNVASMKQHFDPERVPEGCFGFRPLASHG